MDAALESIWKTYEMVNDWIRFSDAKAGAILTADGVLVGIFLALLPHFFSLSTRKFHTCSSLIAWNTFGMSFCVLFFEVHTSDIRK